jgi:hypothetical protein
LITLGSKKKQKLRARVAELEAVAQWHDASEPPEKLNENFWSREVIVDIGGQYDLDQYMYDVNMWGNGSNVKHWRDLPPMLEVKQ